MVRGQRYAKQQLVSGSLDLYRQENGLILAGNVEGSLKHPYRTEVTMRLGAHGVDLFTLCSCPVGNQCKHAVALIQTFINQAKAEGWAVFAEHPSPDAEAPASPDEETLTKWQWEAWINQVETAPDNVTGNHRVGREYRLGLLVDAGMGRQLSDTPTLAVMPVWLRPSKQRGRGSGWVAPRHIELGADGQLQPAPEDGWEVATEEAIDRLLHGDVSYMHPRSQGLWILVADAFQARALWRLLESQTPPLVFYQRQTGPQLQLGAACQLTTTWQADDQGVQRLAPMTDPADTVSSDVIFATAGRELCYLDPERGCLGRLEGTPERLAQVRRAPPLPPALASGWMNSFNSPTCYPKHYRRLIESKNRY